MKTKNLILSLLCLMPLFTFGQDGITQKGSLNIVRETKPPVLSVVKGSVKFVDQSGNNAIDANEVCYIEFDVANSGMGNATGCIASAQLTGNMTGVGIQQVSLPIIEVGKTQHVVLPIKSTLQTTDGQINLTINVSEPMGFGITPFEMQIRTHAFAQPLVKVADYALGEGVSVIQKTQPFDLTVAVQNMSVGDAEKVLVNVVLPDGVYLVSSNENLRYDTLQGGQAKAIKYQMIVSNSYNADNVPVQINLSERYGQFAESRTIDLPLNQALSNRKIKIDEKVVNRQKIEQLVLTSDVDKNIPTSDVVNSNTFVLIIANENYESVAPVQFALRDGKIFRQYCISTLGIPENNIQIFTDATLNHLRRGVNWLKNALSVDKNAKAIVYYTGHGIPDEATHSAYLLPVDGTGSDVVTAYSIDNLYTALGETGKSATVFLDACFSGAKRDGSMLLAAKGVAIKVKRGVPQGKTVVFSAATGDETAGFYEKQEHGMFTYWLLKTLQQTAGDISYGELGTQLEEKVKQSSFMENNGKIQTPTVMYGSEVEDWQSWTLK